MYFVPFRQVLLILKSLSLLQLNLFITSLAQKTQDWNMSSGPGLESLVDRMKSFTLLYYFSNIDTFDSYAWI